MLKTRKFFKRAYALAMVAAAFVATVAPAVIRAADLVPQPVQAVQTRSSTPSILYLRVTAYSSTPEETDSTPFITANGTRVHDGIVATNFLPFGTEIQIPSLFGNKIFTVEDRMAKRLTDVIDIWMPTKTAALRFGANYASIIIVNTSTANAVGVGISKK